MTQTFSKLIFEGRKHLKKVQRADPKTKKRYLVGVSALLMFGIIGLWFFYVSFSLPGVGSNEEDTKVESESFFDVFDRGFRRTALGFKMEFTGLKAKLKEGAVFLNSQIDRSREFSLEAEDQNFVFEEEETVFGAPLP